MQDSQSTFPRDRTPFIGRKAERTLVSAELDRSSALLTMIGPAGVGKTRLARQIIADVAERFVEGGAWFCDLGLCQSAEEVEAAVARLLGIPQNHGEALVRSLANRGRLLLILDNLDGLAGACRGLLESWMDGARALQIVTTSIVPSEVEGEVRFELGPLELADAVDLYLDRAHRAWSGTSFPPTERPIVEELVRRLDRFPLAIELAAARIRILPPKALLARLDERFSLLRSGGSGRHDSLLEAISLTWELLSSEEASVLTQTSIFERSFSPEAAQALVQLPGDRPVDLLDLLDRLRSKALLQLDHCDPPRFLLFESIRAFARDRLEKSGTWDQLSRRHAAFFVEEAEARAAEIERPGALEIIRWLEAERENLIAILLRHGEGEPALAARAGLAYYALLDVESGSPSETELLERIVRAARRSGDSHLNVRALRTRAIGSVQRGLGGPGLADLKEALELARRIGARWEEGDILNRMGMESLLRGEVEAANRSHDEAISLGQREKLPLIEATGWLQRGTGIRLISGGPEEGERSYSRAIELFRLHSFPRRQGVALNNLGGTLLLEGRYREARPVLREALQLFLENGNRMGEARALSNLGAGSHVLGHLEEARQHLERALATQRELGSYRLEGNILGNLGILALEEGDIEQAEALLHRSADIAASFSDRRGEATRYLYIAVVETLLGRRDEARRCLEAGRAYYNKVNDKAHLEAVGLFETLVELLEARRLHGERSPQRSRLVADCRQRMLAAASSPDSKPGSLTIPLRLLEKELEHWTEPVASTETTEGAPERLLVGAGGAWFAVGEERIHLRRRISLRRMLDALTQKRLNHPGSALTPHELFEAGWPDVRIQPDAAMGRLYFGIHTLRKLGLAEVLLNQTDGYLLDPKIQLEQLEE